MSPTPERVTVALSVSCADKGIVRETWENYVPGRFGIDVVSLDNPPKPTPKDFRRWQETIARDDIGALVVANYRGDPRSRIEDLSEKQRRFAECYPALSTVGNLIWDDPLPWDMDNIRHIKAAGEKPVFAQRDPLEIKSFKTPHANVGMRPSIRNVLESANIINVGRDIAQIKEEILYP